jgi:CrcB protein
VTYLYVMAGAAAGAPLRYFAAAHVQGWTNWNFPTGTMFVNLTGCLLIGFIATLAEERDFISRDARLLLITGFLGSYTTFSAFGYETFELLRANYVARAGFNVALSCTVGVMAAWVGMALARFGD